MSCLSLPSPSSLKLASLLAPSCGIHEWCPHSLVHISSFHTAPWQPSSSVRISSAIFPSSLLWEDFYYLFFSSSIIFPSAFILSPSSKSACFFPIQSSWNPPQSFFWMTVHHRKEKWCWAHVNDLLFSFLLLSPSELGDQNRGRSDWPCVSWRIHRGVHVQFCNIWNWVVILEFKCYSPKLFFPIWWMLSDTLYLSNYLL